MDAYENLANAIVVRAAEDYREALKALNLNREDRDALAMKKDCERFFQSAWFAVLTEVDGSWLMRKLKGEARTV